MPRLHVVSMVSALPEYDQCPLDVITPVKLYSAGYSGVGSHCFVHVPFELNVYIAFVP